jgi:hypothetical protein
MRRREFIAGLGGAAVGPLAKQSERVRQIGVLHEQRCDRHGIPVVCRSLYRGTPSSSSTLAASRKSGVSRPSVNQV